MKNYNQLREIIQKANNDICETEPCWKCGSNGMIDEVSVCTDCQGEGHFNICREIRLADVMIAMRDKFTTRISKEFKEVAIKLLMLWAFRENLENQNRKCKQFLIDLLIEKK